MRKTKSIKIDDLEITVKELRVKDIRQIMDNMSDFSGMDQALELLPLVTDLTAEKLDDMAPSEINQIWEAVREVNAFFLNLLTKSGMAEALKNSVLSSLTEAFADLSNGDMPDVLSTDSASLKPPVQNQPA
ncbi:phage tail assembly protein [Desulfobacula phenolica]|uniref:Phage tail assembly chaperone protein, E, or 41 or 14 n=1 Tax=Desulfobacula phenolica TaxID=90732 RepID=A0A1H2I2J8_9BACT|nr:phage tail assembly protein [Desulfobacula phenolica]SDU38279.1 Phage tail assembly chaperone protein, E, or 41 or 14 [Desulfobacula phenolica]